MLAVEINEISKSYDSTKALNNINLNIEQGEIFGLIGPDGAGKTTLIRILTTLLIADEGNISVLGSDVVNEYKKIRTMLGYMPGKFSLYEDLSVEENLRFFASVFNTTIDENYYLIEDIYKQIEPFKDRRAGALSGGMKQKLALSCALIHKPKLLVLDEPTTGVDAVSRVEFWDMLHKLVEHGITIFVSTPYMDEAARCDRVAFIQDGIILAVLKPNEANSLFTGYLYDVISENKFNLLQTLKSFDKAEQVYPFGESIRFVSKIDVNKDEIHEFLTSKGINKLIINKIEADIEDVFMSLMEK